jgi:hypothetical protein
LSTTATTNNHRLAAVLCASNEDRLLFDAAHQFDVSVQKELNKTQSTTSAGGCVVDGQGRFRCRACETLTLPVCVQCPT